MLEVVTGNDIILKVKESISKNSHSTLSNDSPCIRMVLYYYFQGCFVNFQFLFCQTIDGQLCTKSKIHYSHAFILLLSCTYTQ